MASSPIFHSKLRLPGHSRASVSGCNPAGLGTANERRERIQSDPVSSRRVTVGGRMQCQSDPSNDAAQQLQTRSMSDAAIPTSPSSAGHMRVAVRVRPLPNNESGIIAVEGDQTVLIQKYAASGGNGYLSSQQSRVETRSFDRVFGPQASQSEVYEYTCAPLLTEAVAAARCATVFAYGATGAGKTHTIFGVPDAEQEGIILRAIPDIFQAVAEYNQEMGSSESTLQVKVSFLEIYNETVRDLLQDGGGICRVLEDERRGVVQVSNLFEPEVASSEEALAYLEAGMQARTVEATAANLQSSRAHAVFSLLIERVYQSTAQGATLRSRLRRGNPQEKRKLHAKISFIDLAGSERASFTQNVGQALKDGARINQSLLALANCIDALIAQSRLALSTSAPRKKPPFRDSKLTLMLKGSLMGDGLVAMIANVHPGQLHFEDSNNTLEYAKRASTVKASNRRLSRQSLGVVEDMTSSRQSLGVELGSRHQDMTAGDMDDEHITASASVSSLPRPRKTQGVQQLAQAYAKDRTRSCEITTASSPEECLSEISLSSEGDEQGEDLEVASPLASPTAANNPSRSPVMALAAGTPEEDAEQNICWDQVEQRRGRPDKSAQVQSPEHDRSPVTEHCVAANLASTTQKHVQRLDARLRVVTRERNALLKDRQALEDENERLREDGMEKDRQLLMLLRRFEAAETAGQCNEVSM